MLIQPFIENSIIHGFSDIKNGGLLDIYFKIKNNRVIINVSDNGVGRELGKKSKKMKKGNIGTSMGLSLIHGRINLLNELYKKKFTVSISDRLIDNQTAGTEVEIVYDMFN